MFLPATTTRHLREISELQANQRGEVELLYRRLGKAPPPGLGLSHYAPHTGRRKRSSKHRLKPGKLLSPLVQQFRNVTTKSSDSTRSGEHIFSIMSYGIEQGVQHSDARVRLCSGAATAAGEPTVSLNGSPAKGSFPTHSRARSCTSHLPSSTTGPVQTQQPCSLKGSLSSDNIYTGPHRDPSSTHAQPGQGDYQQNRTNIKDLFVVFCLIRLGIFSVIFLLWYPLPFFIIPLHRLV